MHASDLLVDYVSVLKAFYLLCLQKIMKFYKEELGMTVASNGKVVRPGALRRAEGDYVPIE